jgi:hypothetical protein
MKSIKSQLRHLAAVLPTAAAILALTSCSTTPQGEGAMIVAAEKGEAGGTVVETYKITATVTAVDAGTRHVTIETENGAKTKLKAGPEVVNFNQIQVGDKVNAVVTEQLVVYARKNGEPANDGAAALVGLAPQGAKPGMVMASTVEVTANVQAIDLEHRKATLRFSDGTTKTFKVRKDVDLTNAKIGDDVVFRTTEAMAITVEKS